MMWKALILLAFTGIVLAARIKKHDTHYEFHVKHEYDYGHKHAKDNEENENEDKLYKKEEQPVEEQKSEQTGEENVGEEQVRGEEQEEPSNIETETPENAENDELPGYEFLYKVKDHHTHDMKGQHEKKHEGEIMGEYWLLQPDGYKRTVKYRVDKHNGFHANVEYSKHEEDDEAKHNENKEEEDHHVPKSEYYINIHHGLRKPIPITEEVQEEQENQGESAEHRPIYVV